MKQSFTQPKPGGKWHTACDSYGKVQHSLKYDCVYTVTDNGNGEHIRTLAARIENPADARLFAGSLDLYNTLKYMNHDSEHGYCICPLNDGRRPTREHATVCADARMVLARVEAVCADCGREYNPADGVNICRKCATRTWTPAKVGCYWDSNDGYHIGTRLVGGNPNHPDSGYLLTRNFVELGVYPTLEAAQKAAAQ